MLAKNHSVEIDDRILSWLLEGDISIQYQVHRDLLGANDDMLAPIQRGIEHKGWGAELLSKQNPNGHWDKGFYQPKWTSTHYSLLDLRCLCLSRDNPRPRRAVEMILGEAVGPDGAVSFAHTKLPPDVCINGMVLNYAAYFGSTGPKMDGIVDYLLRVQMPEHGWNCEHTHGATHSSTHTTISVLEGLLEYRTAASARGARAEVESRLPAIRQAEAGGVEFLLRHRLYLSDHTGKIIDPRFLMLSYPSRWRYDILRALDYLRAARVPYDERMDPALSVLEQKRRPDGTWPLQHRHPGQAHFEMETVGHPSRWNTLRALRVMDAYGGSNRHS